jgi:glycosyltransferase involved in cell wall biosynthesis
MNFGVLRKPFAIIPYGIDLHAFSRARERPPGRPRVLCVQRLVPSKGTHVLVKALRLLVDRGLSDIHVDIVGDGPERKTLESMVNEIGLRDRVVFHGQQPRERVVSFFGNAGIFCFPTLSEGFGIVLLEAMAAGSLIVASRCTSIPEIVRDGETGMLFEPGDERSLASVLEPALKEPDRFRPLVSAAADAVCDFDLGNVGRRLADILEAMVGWQTSNTNAGARRE